MPQMWSSPFAAARVRHHVRSGPGGVRNRLHNALPATAAPTPRNAGGPSWWRAARPWQLQIRSGRRSAIPSLNASLGCAVGAHDGESQSETNNWNGTRWPNCLDPVQFRSAPLVSLDSPGLYGKYPTLQDLREQPRPEGKRAVKRRCEHPCTMAIVQPFHL